MASNPFVTSTAVRAHNLFFGRQEEIKQLFAAISADPPQNCSVIGLPKSGKSSLLMTLTNEEYQKQHLSDPSQFLFVPVDCSVANLDAPADLYIRLIERIGLACGKPVGGGDIIDIPTFRAAIDELRGGRRMVLLLDEFDVLLASEGCNDAVLASMHDFVGPNVVLVATALDTIERICRRVEKTQAEIWKLFSAQVYPRLLSRDEARRAIKQPITEAGVAVEDAQVDHADRAGRLAPVLPPGRRQGAVRRAGRAARPSMRPRRRSWPRSADRTSTASGACSARTIRLCWRRSSPAQGCRPRRWPPPSGSRTGTC